MLRWMMNAHWALLLAGLLTMGVVANWIAVSTRAEVSPDNVRSRTHSGVPNPPIGSSLPIKQERILEESSGRPGLVKYPVAIRKPAGPPRVDLGIVDTFGKPVTAACSTCHSTRPANHANRAPADLDEFHQLMDFAHGKVSCLSCHNPNDYDTLRLADGSTIEYTDVMTLCAQCHGPQTRDYEHGAHGGMNGYWDLSRGPRARNNCVDCHNPHVPSFPAMKPTFKPRDRFLGGDDSTKASSHE